MKYVLMFMDTEEFAAELAGMGELEREHAYARVREWFTEHHDKVNHHRHLMPPDSATTVRQTAATRGCTRWHGAADLTPSAGSTAITASSR